jgi:hypothetical protein
MMDDKLWEDAKQLKNATDHGEWAENPLACMAVPWATFQAMYNEIENMQLGEKAADQVILKSRSELTTIKNLVEAGDSERIRTVLLALESEPLVWGSCIQVLQRYQKLAKSIEEGGP